MNDAEIDDALAKAEALAALGSADRHHGERAESLAKIGRAIALLQMAEHAIRSEPRR